MPETIMQVAQLSHIGLERGENQDAYGWFKAEDIDLLVLADGMGGHQGGREAAVTLVDAVREWFSRHAGQPLPDLLRQSLEEANARIYQKNLQNGQGSFMGSTAVVLAVHAGRVHLAHVGDSRAYVLRQQRLLPLTKDHTVVQHMVDQGLISPDEGRGHPDGHILSRAVGTEEEVEVELAPEPLPVEEGDLFLLCSDGLSGLVDDQEIQDLLLHGRPLEERAQALVDLALAAGGSDNVTVQLVHFPTQEPTAEAEPSPGRGRVTVAERNTDPALLDAEHTHDPQDREPAVPRPLVRPWLIWLAVIVAASLVGVWIAGNP